MTFRFCSLPSGVAVSNTGDSQRYLHRKALLMQAPFDLDVSQEERSFYASPCSCSVVYRVLETSVSWLRKNGLWRMGVRVVYVCPCMGSLIG